MARLPHDSSTVQSSDGYAAADSAFSQSYPSAFEHLAGLVFEDGKKRETSTLLIFCEEGVWKACLNDRAVGRTMWVSAASFVSLLSSLELALDSGQAEWRRRQKGR